MSLTHLIGSLNSPYCVLSCNREIIISIPFFMTFLLPNECMGILIAVYSATLPVCAVEESWSIQQYFARSLVAMISNYCHTQLYKWVFCFVPLEKELNYRAMNVVLTSANTCYITIGDSLGKQPYDTRSSPFLCPCIKPLNIEVLTQYKDQNSEISAGFTHI